MPRKNMRRAASKEALKQMQRLSSTVFEDDDNTETFEITSDEEVVTIDMPPKKKYRLSHRKSSDGNDRDVIVLKTITNPQSEESLKLEFWTEDLEPAQLEYQNKFKKELSELTTKIDQITKKSSSEVIYQGETCSVYGIDAVATKSSAPVPTLTCIGRDPKRNQSSSNATTTTTTATATTSISQPNVLFQSGKSNNNNQNTYQLLMDPRIGLIVGTVAPTTSGNISPTVLKSKTVKLPNITVTQAKQTKRRGRNSLQTTNSQPTTAKIIKSVPSSNVIQLRNVDASSVGSINVNKSSNSGLGTSSTQKSVANTTSNNVVDLTSDDVRPMDDSREISFNKLQGKTFPSLVVVARPHLSVKDSSGSDRSKLDSKVKNVLMHIPTKFTEWLIQQGLVRSEQICVNHVSTKLKLGMYSDASKFPYSGGYVWISECCPHRFVSVFSGSLFEGSPHPPSIILKLIYHWACQTNVQNVVQWVKVDNLYVKGMYSWLRAVCSVALHTHIQPLGGTACRVEIGVISLGTTSQDGQQRQVKVEVLGILETDAKRIRLRAVEPLAEGDRNYKKRFSKILEPLMQWVDRNSIIVTDLTVDKSTLTSMGFKHIHQSSTNDNINNHVIMEYLRRIVPRMFQNTLSLLSRQIIQQFLDELVWREWYGVVASQAFDNILLHISEQTRADTGQSLILRLNKVSANPFRNWNLHSSTVQVSSNKQLLAEPTSGVAHSSGITSANTHKRYGRNRKAATSLVPLNSTAEAPQKVQRTHSPDIPEQMVPLENYYYGTIEGTNTSSASKHVWTVKCSLCKYLFNNNIKLMMHLFSHAHNITSGVQQCRYCLSSVGSQEGLDKHISSSHPHETRFQDKYVCVICESTFVNTFLLGKHLSKEHVPSELPYQCGTCGYRCSSHRRVIDHFYKVHDSGLTIQCPFCLKSTAVYSGGRVMTQNLNFFMQHLQKHQKKAIAKKCPKCSLWFINKDTLKEHQTNMHASQRRKMGLVAWSAPKNCIMVPKSKYDKLLWEDRDREINLSNLVINIPSNFLCKECKSPVNAAKHFQALESCSNRNCQYSTSCKSAMKAHADLCKDINAALPISSLTEEMHCVCGYSDKDGNKLAKHLAECERKSAYPSVEAAKKAIRKDSMLDVLGLVRRPEEPVTSISNDVEIAKNESDKESSDSNSLKRKRRKEKDFTAAKQRKISESETAIKDVTSTDEHQDILDSTNDEEPDKVDKGEIEKSSEPKNEDVPMESETTTTTNDEAITTSEETTTTNEEPTTPNEKVIATDEEAITTDDIVDTEKNDKLEETVDKTDSDNIEESTAEDVNKVTDVD